MSVYLPTAVVGNDHTLITLGDAGELMGWFYPSKDHAQHIYQCMPCVYLGHPQMGTLRWTWGDEWERHQEYVGDSNVCRTTVNSSWLDLRLEFLDIVPEEGAVLVRQITVHNLGDQPCTASFFHYGDWNIGGLRTGNAVRYEGAARALIQSHRTAAVAIGGDALQTWQCGKAGTNWSNNAKDDLKDGMLACQDLEIGDVNWAFGFSIHLPPGGVAQRTAIFAFGPGEAEAFEALQAAAARTVSEHTAARQAADAARLGSGLRTLEKALPLSPILPEKALPVSSSVPGKAGQTTGSDLQKGTTTDAGNVSALPGELLSAYKRSLLCLPLLCGEEGVAVAAPEFDPEFEYCGGYGYFWPRDGAEYVSGLMDAGYPGFSVRLFDWCARHQDPAGLWHQRYFLNGELGPNWCLPPDMLQIDQVGAVLWAYGKWEALGKPGANTNGPEADNRTTAHHAMVRKAADYLVSRLTHHGVHASAFDTWETFIGSFTYSNAAIYAALQTAARVLNAPEYTDSARHVKRGVLEHFVLDGSLRRGFNRWGQPDWKIDSSALGAIEPFGLLDLEDANDLKIAEGTLRAIMEQLEIGFEGGLAIRRFEGDTYVGGAPACVNTLWMARCCCSVATRLRVLGRRKDAARLIERARIYLTTVLRRATPTGLLPELMQGPTVQRYWAAPHGWAMASFVSGVLQLAKLLSDPD